ncbi:MAG: hypothetical protein IK115_08970 [Lachnospiraceae bacterium]|nr:hypothetical protein [Lachnospiraceae bacterium]
MDEKSFIRDITALKETAVLQGGVLSEEQVEEVFPALTKEQKDVLMKYFHENHIGIGEALPDEEILDPEENDHIRIYREELESLVQPDEDMKRVLVINALNGDITAREKLTQAYLGNVLDIARLYTGQGAELADLIGEGNLALAAAMNMLGSIEGPEDCDALVSRTVMNAMEELIAAENAETEAFQRSMLLVMKAVKAAKELSEEMRRKVSVAEVLAETEMSEDELKHAISLSPDLLEYIAL